jgi:hypothetical protein
VQLIEADVEFAYGVSRDLQGERRDVGTEETVESLADAIVVERGQVGVRQSQEFGLMPRRPLADTIKWLARDQQVPQEYQQGCRRGDRSATILTGQVVVKKLMQAEAAEKTLQDRERCNPP